MEGDTGASRIEKKLRNRIAQGVRRRDAAPERVDVDPRALPRQVLETTEYHKLEEQTLERDLAELHDTFAVGNVPLVRSPGRALAPVVASVRRLTLGALSPVLDRQTAFNGAVARSLSIFRDRSVRQQELLQAANTALTAALADVLTPAVRAQAKALQELERRIRLLERESRDGGPVRGLDEFEFANRFRGSEDSLRARQRQYVELFNGVTEEVIDFGCGRGEFLELLRDSRIPARGIDLDRRMVEHCRAKGLSAEFREGLAYLESLPPDSLGGIFASQVIEHLELSSVLSLLRLARRALTPGGVLLLETHNPQTFLTYPLYTIDPTHVRLYHSETISWLLEQEGFISVEVRFGDPAAEGLDPAAPESDDFAENLTSILHGYLTYAAIGRVPSG
jgi:SAM-dependent methyltransferase